MPHKPHNVKVIGRREFIDLPQLGIAGIEAKMDSGAFTASLHCENLRIDYENSKPILYFTVEQSSLPVLRFENFTQRKIKNSFGEMEERYVIHTLVKIGKKNILADISLSNRDNMRYPVLIGRRMLKGKFLVDVNQIHTGGVSLKKAVKELNLKNNQP
ncbi:MAG: RimK/LysX family protein [Bacteroidetes bacterium]|nr:RimK/LysX family protein [Bacteroidota bacterium]